MDQKTIPQNRYIRVSSEDKAQGTNSRFEVNLPSSIVLDNITSMTLKYASVPNIFSNVASYNNGLNLVKQTGAVSYNVSVPVGQYSITSFITALETAINAVIPDVVTITDVDGKLRFQFAGDSYSLSYTNSTVRDVIGLAADTGFTTDVTLSLPYNLTGPTECFVHSQTLNEAGLTEASGIFSVIGVIPLDKPYGSNCYLLEPDGQMAKVSYTPYESRRSVRSIDIVLRDRVGNVLDLPSNFYFSILLKVEYVLGSM